MIVVEHPAKTFSKKTAADDVPLSGKPGVMTGLVVLTRPVQSARKVHAKRHDIRQVAVIEVTGRLSDAVDELDREIELALADGPRGVVCDLSAVLEGADPVAVEILATAGRHVRDWPGIPVALACPDPQVRAALGAHPLGAHLIVAESKFSAISAVLATRNMVMERLQLAAHPTAPRAARNFVTRTLLDWRLGRVIPFATLVVSELVSSSSVNAGTDINLCIVWDQGALRLTVRDRGPALPNQRPASLDLHGRGLNVIAGLSRAFGVLPTSDGGQAVWAVLDAPRPQLSTRAIRSERSTPALDSPIFNDGRGLTELPFCAGSRR